MLTFRLYARPYATWPNLGDTASESSMKELTGKLTASGGDVQFSLDKMSSQMLYRYILRRTLIVSTAKRHKQLQLTSRKTR